MPPDSTPAANQRGRSRLSARDAPELRERGEVGVHARRVRRSPRSRRPRPRRTRASRAAASVEERHSAVARRVAESADGHDLQHEVADARHDERDRGRDGDDAARVAELPRDVRAHLPSGESPDEQADRGADARPTRAAGTAGSSAARPRVPRVRPPRRRREQQRREHELQPARDAHAEGIRDERRDEEDQGQHGDHRTVDSRRPRRRTRHPGRRRPGAPAHTPNMNQYPVIRAAVSPSARRT